MAEHLLLVGMMGAGKSTVARLVAARLGRPHIDTDVEVERAAGSSVSEIFSTRGEAGFRAEEARVLTSILAGGVPAVISVGGGAILDPGQRSALRAAGPVVWLRARPGTLARRVGKGVGRPLLAGAGDGMSEGPAGVLARIEAERRALYEEVASVVIDVDDLTPGAVADRVVRAGGSGATKPEPMITVPVRLEERSYDVVVGAGARGLLPEMLPAGVERVAVVTQENVEVEVDAGVPSETFVIEDGESAKTQATVERLCRDFVRFGLSRSDAVVALGGGVVSDVAGFAASVFLPRHRVRQRPHHTAGAGRRRHRGQDRL